MFGVQKKSSSKSGAFLSQETLFKHTTVDEAQHARCAQICVVCGINDSKQTSDRAFDHRFGRRIEND